MIEAAAGNFLCGKPRLRKQCHGNRRELRRARRGVDFGIKLLFESIES